MAASLYISNNYNLMGVELRLDGPLDYEVLERITYGTNLLNYSINYEGSTAGFKTIMTTGNDLLFKNIKMEQGDFITRNDRNVVALGDRVSDKYFRTADAVGKNISIYGITYEVKGVIKNSDLIYIPYNKDMLNDNWSRVIVRFQPYTGGEYKNFHLRANNIMESINNNPYTVINSIKYMNVAYFYRNISIIILISILLNIAVKIYKSLKENLRIRYEDYQIRKLEMSIFRYISINIKDIINTAFKILIELAAIYAMYKIATYTRIDKDFFPDNFLALESYTSILKDLYNSWKLRLENGLTPIMMDFLKVNVFILTTMIILMIPGRKAAPNEDKSLGEGFLEQ